MMPQPVTLPADGVSAILAIIGQLSAWIAVALLVRASRGMPGSKEPR